MKTRLNKYIVTKINLSDYLIPIRVKVIKHTTAERSYNVRPTKYKITKVYVFGVKVFQKTEVPYSLIAQEKKKDKEMKLEKTG